MPSSVASEADICNGALVCVGVGQFLDNLSEDTAEARACDQIYARTRDALLEKAPWKFARRRAVLALSTEERTGWAYVYALPSDCLAPLFLDPGVLMPAAAERVPFDWEAGTSGSVAGPALLLTNQEEAELHYTARVENVSLFSPGFVEALEWAIAAKLALVLPIKPALAAQAKVEAKRLLLEATATMLNHSQRSPAAESEYVSGR